MLEFLSQLLGSSSSDQSASASAGAADQDLMQKILSNRALFAALIPAGLDIMKGGGLGENTAKFGMQTYASQSMAQVLKKLLEGGGKLSLDAQNASLKFPSYLLTESDKSKIDTNLPSDIPTGTKPASVQEELGKQQAIERAKLGLTSGQAGLETALINPSASSLGDLTSADLVGLTPDDVAKALQLKMANEEIKRKSVSDTLDNMIRLAALEGKLTPKPETRTNEIKNFEYAVSRGYTGSFEEFISEFKDPSNIREYKLSKSEGYDGTYLDWLAEKAELTHRPGTVVNIGDKVDLKEALDQVEMRSWVQSPNGLQKDLDKLKFEDYMFEIMPKVGYDTDRARREFTKMKVNMVDTKVRQAFGANSILGAKWLNNNTISITVKTPSGDTKELVYGISR